LKREVQNNKIYYKYCSDNLVTFFLTNMEQEQIQQVILNSLDKRGSISDTRTLIDENGQGFESSESQMAIQSALSSLESRQVRRYIIIITFVWPIGFPIIDGGI
jgi:hypothetical protein